MKRKKKFGLEKDEMNVKNNNSTIAHDGSKNEKMSNSTKYTSSCESNSIKIWN